MNTNWILTLAFVFAIIISGNSQQLNFNAKAIKLIPENSFLPNADWESLFYDKAKTNVPSRVGINKQVRIAPDGSVFISDRRTFTITKLDNTGRFVKTFGKKGWNDGEFANNQDLDGFLDDKLLVVSDNQGRINFFDLDGNFVKLITIDFMPLVIRPAKAGKLIIYGHVPYGGKSKKMIAELDYETGQYEQIYYTFQSYDAPGSGISIPYKQGMIGIGPPFSSRNIFRLTDDNNIIFCSNNSNIVRVFSKENNKYNESQFQITVNPISLTEKEKEDFYQNLKERLIKKDIDPIHAEKVKEKGFFPEHLPYYYNLIVDDKSNCLFFVYSNENQDHLFQAYDLEGKYLGESEFKIDGYDLMSKLGHFTFMDGYIYTLALKHNEDAPLRILKCSVKNEM